MGKTGGSEQRRFDRKGLGTFREPPQERRLGHNYNRIPSWLK